MKRKILALSASVLLIAVVWQVMSLCISSSLILPNIQSVFLAFIKCLGSRQFYASLAATFLRCLTAFSLAVIVGAVLGFTSGASSFFKTFIFIPLWIIRATPVVSLILISLFWLKAKQIPSFVAFLMALPVMTGATQKGVSTTPKELLEAADSYSLGRRQKIRFVYIPNIRPFFLEGLSASYGLVWKAVAAGEVLALPKQGLGTLLNTYQVHLETSYVMAVTAAIIIAGFLSEGIFTLTVTLLKKHICKNRINHWHFAKENKNFSTDASLCIRELSFSYEERHIIKNFTLEAKEKTTTAIMAKTGSGKTTLLNAIAKKLKQDGRAVSYVFQEPRLFPQLTVFENICLPLCNVMTKKTAFKTAEDIIEKTNLVSYKEKLPSELSGGEKQRVSLARAFAYPASILLMDEAFKSQDIEQEVKLLCLLEKLLCKKNRTVLFVTHNAREACVCADTILVMKGPPLEVQKEINMPALQTQTKQRYISPSKSSALYENEIYRLLMNEN
mgnify:FL=1